jgi:hypothetical protein
LDIGQGFPNLARNSRREGREMKTLKTIGFILVWGLGGLVILKECSKPPKGRPSCHCADSQPVKGDGK